MSNLFSDEGIRLSDFDGKRENFRIGYGQTLVPDERRVAEIIRRAEGYLEMDIPVLPLSLYRECSLTKNRWHFEGFHHRRREMLISMVLAEHAEGKGRFIVRICDLMWAILEETSWVIPAHTFMSPTAPGTDVPETWDPELPCALDLYAGSASANLALALHLLGDKIDAISPIIAQRVKYSVRKRCLMPFIEGDFWWMRRMNNWATQIIGSVLLVMATLEDDADIRAQVLDKAAKILDRFVDSYPEDGACDEGFGYWGGASGCLFDDLEIIYDITEGRVNVFNNPKLRVMGEYVTHGNVHGEYYVDFADCVPRFTPDGVLIARYGRRVGSPEMVSFGRWAGSGVLMPESILRMPYRAYMGLCTPYYEDRCEVFGAKFVAFPDRQIFMMRAHEQTDRGFYVAIKGGHNDENHNHLDVGCFMLYSNGQPIAVDPGMGIYLKFQNWFDRYNQWHFRSTYHNLPSFNGVEQYHGGEYKAKILECNEEESRIVLDLSSTYLEGAQLDRYIRTAEIDNDRAVIKDEITLKSEGDIVLHLTLVDEPRLVEPGVIITGNTKMTYDPALEFSCEPIEGGNFRYQLNWKRDRLWLLSLKAHGVSLNSEMVFEMEAE